MALGEAWGAAGDGADPESLITIEREGKIMMEDKSIQQTVRSILHPKLKKPLLDLGMIRDLTIKEGEVTLTLAVKHTTSPMASRLVDEIEKSLNALPEVSSVHVRVVALSEEEAQRLFPKPPLRGIEKTKRFLAVASGKGGVGKTTIAVNVALALAEMGYSVGLLDADVYGPSIPVMLGLSGVLDREGDMIIPKGKFGLRIMSLGMTTNQTEAFIWRGPLVSKMINQLLDQVKWDELDYLVIDLPPGTGDPSITIAQALPRCSVLMVTTPQEVALADVRRSITLFKKIGRHIIGLVENMSYFLCGHASEPIGIFGKGGGEKLSRETGIDLLGAVPLDPELGRGGDNGIPLLVSTPDGETSAVFKSIAQKIANRIDRSQDISSGQP